MWKLWHKIFGWQYVEYRDSATSFVARIQGMPNGRLRMICGLYSGHYNAFLKEDGTFDGASGEWRGLTFTGGRPQQ